MGLDVKAVRLQLVDAKGVIDYADQAANAITRHHLDGIIDAGIIHQDPLGIVVDLPGTEAPNQDLLGLRKIARTGLGISLCHHAELAEPRSGRRDKPVLHRYPHALQRLPKIDAVGNNLVGQVDQSYRSGQRVAGRLDRYQYGVVDPGQW